jgi:hypothetical protein
MRRLISVLTIILLTACSSLQPIEMDPTSLQQSIKADKLIKIGEKVIIFTNYEKSYEFNVVSVTETEVIGKSVSVPIKDIIALKTAEFSGGKTALVVGTLSAFAYLMYMLPVVAIGL